MTKEKELSVEELIAEMGRGYRLFKVFEHGQEVAKSLLTLKQQEREATSNLEDLKIKTKNQEALLEDARIAAVKYKEQTEQDGRNVMAETAKKVADAEEKYMADFTQMSATLSSMRSDISQTTSQLNSLLNEKSSLEKEIAALKEEKAKALEHIQRQFA